MSVFVTRFARTAWACTLAAAAGLAAFPAFSQSADYRQGYDRGYQDGIAAARGQRGEQPRPGPGYSGGSGGGGGNWRPSGISVADARYGTQGSYCDATPAVRDALRGPHQRGVLADNGLCGDPASNRPKALTVTYSCEGRQLQRATVREGDVFYFDCR